MRQRPSKQGDLSADQLEKLRGWARDEAVITVLEAIGPDNVFGDIDAALGRARELLPISGT